MNKLLRLALLLSLAFLASWSAAPENAYALALCDSFDGKGCTTPGKVIPCLWRNEGNGACYCDPATRRWEC